MNLSGDPTLYLFAGSNGAGKTTFARAYLLKEQITWTGEQGFYTNSFSLALVCLNCCFRNIRQEQIPRHFIHYESLI